MKDNSECKKVEQLFNYATRGDLNCGCPNLNGDREGIASADVDIFIVDNKQIKTEIKTDGTWTTFETYTGKGADYRGAQNKTISGKDCQAWDQTTPHTPNDTLQALVAAKDEKTNLVGNFCRNPDDESAPWCYTTTECPSDDLNCADRFDYCEPIAAPATPVTSTTETEEVNSENKTMVTTTVKTYTSELVNDTAIVGKERIWFDEVIVEGQALGKNIGIDECAKLVAEN